MVNGKRWANQCIGYAITVGRTISRWERGDSVPSFTIPQMKALDELLKAHGKTLQDLPDSFAAGL